RFELALQDKFSLAELNLWSAETLADWTSGSAESEDECDRFHVHLVADLPAGVSSMLPLGAALSERWVLEGMRETKKSFGLTFPLRRGHTVEVLLIDASDPTAVLSALGRVPSLMVVCPPEGNLLALGSSARVGLGRLIEALAPPAILGVGG